MNIALRRVALVAAVTAPLALLPLAGCRIDTHKNGNNDNVDIGTPFGSMHVKTNDAANGADIGLATYPGAVPVKEHDGRNNDAADINMSFGSFHLGVRAASFHTSDPAANVLAFYRKDLSRYGDVIECRNDKPVGLPTHTAQGLACDSGHSRMHSADSDGDELRAGSEQHQHIVGIEPSDGGIKIALVTLDLPSHLSDHGSKDVE